MRIERQTRRASPTILGCGCVTLAASCLIIAAVAVVLLVPALPNLTLQLAGFQSTGDTEAVFSNLPSPPPVQVQNPAVPSQAIIELGPYGSETLNPNLYDYTIATGTGAQGGQLATVSFSESALLGLCQQHTALCSGGNDQIRNGRIDLRPGGAVIYGEVYIPQMAMWQPAGAVLQMNGPQQVVVTGIDVNGTLYTAPPAAYSDAIEQIEQTGNEVLRQLALNAEGLRYTLSEVQIDDHTLTLILK